MKKIIITVSLAVNIAFVFAQNKQSENFSFSLKQAVDYGLQNQNNIKNAELDQQIARMRVKEITGMGLPQINSGFDLKYFFEIPTTVIPNFVSPAVYAGLVQAGAAPYDPSKMSPDGYPALQAKFGTQYNATASVDASQLLLSGDYFLGLKASKVFVELSEKAVQRTKIEATAAITKAYYTVLVNQERMKLMDANVSRLKKALDDTKILYENGFVEKIDYDRLTVAYTNLLVEQEKVQRLLALGTYLLKYQMGMDVNATLTLTDKLEDVKFDVTQTVSAEKFDYTKRVEYNLFQTQFTLAKLDVKRNRFSYMPNAFAYGSVGGSAMRNEFDIFDTKKPWYPTALVGVKFTMPIFTGGQRYFKTQQAKLKLAQAQNNIDFITQSIDLDIAVSTTNLQNASQSLEIHKKNIQVAEDVYRVTKAKQEQGVGTTLEMVTAETALKEAQTNYFNALFEALVAKIDYDKATGNLK
jgi:outer membrane protein TolC